MTQTANTGFVKSNDSVVSEVGKNRELEQLVVVIEKDEEI